MAWRSMVGRLILDLGLWLVAPFVFLVLYSRASSAGADAALAHLRLVLAAWAGLALLRLAVAYFVPGARLARAIVAFVVALAITTTLFYYTAVLIGLQSWGRVISWDLIRSYAIQAPALADALGVSFHAAVAALAMAFAVVFAAAWMYAGRFGWITRISRRLAPRMVILVLVGGA
ncbi:MAG TPA: hypothetical protein VD867_02800, partial [Burkholderiales bacterium]|nr:hypothetical protein [Burkholderiales bacterium]